MLAPCCWYGWWTCAVDENIPIRTIVTITMERILILAFLQSIKKGKSRCTKFCKAPTVGELHVFGDTDNTGCSIATPLFSIPSLEVLSSSSHLALLTKGNTIGISILVPVQVCGILIVLNV